MNHDFLAVSRRQSDLFGLGQPVRRSDNGAAVRTVDVPRNDDEMLTFCGELLQYDFLKSIRDIQAGSQAMTSDLVHGRVTMSLELGAKLSHMTSYPATVFGSVIASNRFSNSEMESFYWDGLTFPLPTNTKIRLIHQVSSPETGPEKHIIQLRKPRYFDIEITLKPIMSPGPGVVPDGIILDPDVQKRCRTFRYQVSLRSDFDRRTSGKWETDELKKWAKWLFEELGKRLGDPDRR
jgi:hypothetical protein